MHKLLYETNYKFKKIKGSGKAVDWEEVLFDEAKEFMTQEHVSVAAPHGPRISNVGIQNSLMSYLESQPMKVQLLWHVSRLPIHESRES